MVEAAAAALEVEPVFIAAGCNRVVHNVSWGACGLVAFGAQNAVALFSPDTAQILTTLPGHKAAVNCTLWLPSKRDAAKDRQKELHYLLSGSSDGVIMAWKIYPGNKKWCHALQLPPMHKKGVTCLAGSMVSENIAVFTSTSSDGVVAIWEMVVSTDSCEVSCLDSISVGSKPMVAVSIASLPRESGHLLLAMGGLDHKVHLYCGSKSGKFTQACDLKGHSDWVRSLDFSLLVTSESEESTLYLASSSQDKTIRIWKISSQYVSSGSVIPVRVEDIGMTAYIEGPQFSVGNSHYQVSLESLLVGHEDWVYSVEWMPSLLGSEGEIDQPMSILSASMDKMMMIWKPEKTSGIWINAVTVGELTHSALGFYGGPWSPDGKSILAHGYGGSFHLWRNVGTDTENWQPQGVPSGHFSSVSDLAWAKSGDYLLTVSHDQTSRIFSHWLHESSSSDKISWHEIARPQIHGHDINCVAIIQSLGNHRFISGADEKVARVFEAPLSFLRTLQHALQKTDGLEDICDVQALGANMSALGLSQKPIFTHGTSESWSSKYADASDSLETLPDAVPTIFSEPPVEEQLAWNTLWPETHKLYGHGNELFSVCCDHQGKLVASSCKAQTAIAAEVWLWEVGTWRALARLQSHTLTVTQIAFSYDDAFLLTVSRDRQFSVFSIMRSGDGAVHQLIAKCEAHKRIIWACAWNPFGYEFATGSRDKTAKIWSVCDGGSSVSLVATLPPFCDAVTALSWSGVDRSCNSGILAVGMDNGLIELWNVVACRAAGVDVSKPVAFTADCAIRLDPFLCHVSTVHRLQWRHSESSGGAATTQLASCGADNCVRVFEVSYQKSNPKHDG